VTAKLTAFAAVFAVAEVPRAIAFYRDRLGFAVQFVLGDPAEYAIMERGAVSLHLMPPRREPDLVGRGTVYVFVDDCDALHADCVGRGCAIEVAPADFDYGMREFSLRDPDGNRLTFGQAITS
jgi:predicted enzyme related to lactoylglutathione lyase